MTKISDQFISNLLAAVFAKPQTVRMLNLSQWDLLVRQARRAGVLARLGFLLEQKSLLEYAPDPVLNHIQSAQIVSRQFNHSLNWEINCIQKSLRSIDSSWVFLKGAAYALAGNMAAQGRMFADIDILVAKERLSDSETLLRQNGWVRNNLSSYDQKYYIEWMHELPPMSHVIRHTSLDLHHNILPITSRLCPDANKLLANSVKVSGRELWVLAPEDRVLHSAAHLFHEGDFSHGFRDLSDLDLLIKEFSMQENFWIKLLQRSDELNQKIPLHYALRYTSQILKTPMPVDVLKLSNVNILNKPKEKLMDFLFLRALMPDHASCDDSWTALARWLLYIRSHYLKMPLHLLIPHLSRKAWMRLTGKEQH